jgi:hypothetical protein
MAGLVPMSPLGCASRSPIINPWPTPDRSSISWFGSIEPSCSPIGEHLLEHIWPAASPASFAGSGLHSLECDEILDFGEDPCLKTEDRAFGLINYTMSPMLSPRLSPGMGAGILGSHRPAPGTVMETLGNRAKSEAPPSPRLATGSLIGIGDSPPPTLRRESFSRRQQPHPTRLRANEPWHS